MDPMIQIWYSSHKDNKALICVKGLFCWRYLSLLLIDQMNWESIRIWTIWTTGAVKAKKKVAPEVDIQAEWHNTITNHGVHKWCVLKLSIISMYSTFISK